MPSHYAYVEPNKKTLCQGDILKKTADLVAHLKKYHPYYADHADYKYFMVLTQSCDLVRRKGKPCNSQYITLAAARPVEEALLREAAKRQDDWQKEARVISAKERDNLANFVKSLIDNNKERYFYIHTDVSVEIQQNCCVFLQLAVSLKSEHYEMCLAAKICELDETFQAKLGYQIGHMYNRVGTTEWDTKYPDNDVDTFAQELIEDIFVVFEERQIKEGVADLKRQKHLCDENARRDPRLYRQDEGGGVARSVPGSRVECPHEQEEAGRFDPRTDRYRGGGRRGASGEDRGHAYGIGRASRKDC